MLIAHYLLMGYQYIMKKCKIIIADDHAIVRDAIKLVIDKNEHLKVIAAVSDGIELLGALKKLTPDVTIVDLKMPRIQGVETIEEIKSLYPDINVIVWSGYLDEKKTRKAIAAGAYGIVAKSAPKKSLVAAIETVWKGGFYISSGIIVSDVRNLFVADETETALLHMEKAIITLIMEGHTSKQIGDMLNMSKRTVDKHRAMIMSKLNLRNVADLVRYAIKQDLTSFNQT